MQDRAQSNSESYTVLEKIEYSAKYIVDKSWSNINFTANFHEKKMWPLNMTLQTISE